MEHEVPTYTATIYCGRKVGYSGDVLPVSIAQELIQQYVNDVGLCVSLTETTFIYTGGSEPGLIVGLINYPRFPSSPDAIQAHAEELARRLRTAYQQLGVSVVASGETKWMPSEEAK